MADSRIESKETGVVPAASIPPYFQKKNRFSKEKFTAMLKQYWLEHLLQNHPEQFQSATAQKILEQGWLDYIKVCEFFDANNVFTNDFLHQPRKRKLSDYYDKLYLIENHVDMNIYLIYPVMFIETFNLPKLSPEDRQKIKSTIDLPFFSDDSSVAGADTSLLCKISNSEYADALLFVDLGADINKYSAHHGNNPLLLAVSKGWDHKDDQLFLIHQFFSPYAQRKIITRLLKDKALDVNAIHLANGMTALHIACLRGDDPELIKLLLNKGADKDATDYEGRTPLDVLDLSYMEVQQLIWELASVYTLPDRNQRKKNQTEIRRQLQKFNSTLAEYKNEEPTSAYRQRFSCPPATIELTVHIPAEKQNKSLAMPSPRQS